jgi:hypothetical protein
MPEEHNLKAIAVSPVPKHHTMEVKKDVQFQEF